MSKMKLAVIGCGGMAKAHAGRYDKVLSRVQVVAAVDVERTRAQAVADLLPGARTATDYREVLDDVDAVLIALPHHLHHPVGMECLARGKHVLMEKPLANSERECLDLIAASEKAGKVLMTAYCMRFHPLVIGMKKLIDSRDLGDCFQVSIWTEQHTEREPDNWMCRAATLGGGQFFSHGCHYVDILLWYLGEPLRGLHMGTNYGTIEFRNRAMGYHFGTWGAKGSRLKYSFHAHCTDGMIELALREGKLIVHSKGEERTVMTATSAKPTEEEMAHFLDCVETGATPITNARESLRGLRVIWKLYEAEQRGVVAYLGEAQG